MHLKFLARGAGSTAAAVRYLLGERDHSGQPRAGVEVLRGNPDDVAAVADSLEFEHKYTSGVLAWAPADQPTDEQIGQVLDEFEQLAWAGLERDRYAWAAVLHRERDGGAHVHVLAARCDLETGRSLNIAPPGWQKTFDPLRRLAERRARVEPAGRSGASAGRAAGPVPLLRGQGGGAGGAGGGAGPAPAAHRVPVAGHRGGRDRGPGRGGRGTQGTWPRDLAAGPGLRHGAGSGERAEVAAERSDL